MNWLVHNIVCMIIKYFFYYIIEYKSNCIRKYWQIKKLKKKTKKLNNRNVYCLISVTLYMGRPRFPNLSFFLYRRLLLLHIHDPPAARFPTHFSDPAPAFPPVFHAVPCPGEGWVFPSRAPPNPRASPRHSRLFYFTPVLLFWCFLCVDGCHEKFAFTQATSGIFFISPRRRRTHINGYGVVRGYGGGWFLIMIQ